MTAPNPVAFTLFGIDVMWYGLLIGLGFVLAIIREFDTWNQKSNMFTPVTH